jgi:hypothetical protein
MRWTLWGLLLLLLLLAPGGEDVARACSPNAGPSIVETLERQDILVQGRVLQTDARGWSALVEVQQYFKGKGPQYLVVRQNDFIDSHLSRERGDLRCSDPGEHFFEAEQILYLPLTQHELTGTYYLDRYIFDAMNNRNTRYWWVDEGWAGVLDEASLMNLIVALTGQVPASPKAQSSPLQMMNPLLVHTDNGGLYVLPIDTLKVHKLFKGVEAVQFGGSQYPVFLGQGEIFTLVPSSFYRIEMGLFEDALLSFPRLPGMDCLRQVCAAFSPRGLNFLHFSEPNLLNTAFPGQAFLFSPLDSWVAIWNGDQLEVWPRSLVGSRDYIKSKSFTSAPDMLGRGAWSPNERWLAYSDAAGLWLWDVQTDSPPRLLLAPDENAHIPYARQFSPLGTYLAITWGEQNYHLDISTGRLLRDGQFSPDEQLLAAYSQIEDGTWELRVYTDFGEGSEPRFQLCPSSAAPVRPFYWVASNIVCLTEEDGQVGLRFGSPSYYEAMFYGSVRAFDYDPGFELWAMVKAEARVELHGENFFMELDLGDQLDSPIQAIYWYPNLYYHEAD